MASWVKDLGEIIQQNQIVDKVSNAVNTLANKLGVAAEHVYSVFAKQVVCESIAHIVIYISLIIFIFLDILAGKFCHARAKWSDHNGDPENAHAVGYIIACVAGGIVGVIGLIYFFNTVTNTVTGLINPEYRVIHEIAELVKPVQNGK